MSLWRLLAFQLAAATASQGIEVVSSVLVPLGFADAAREIELSQGVRQILEMVVAFAEEVVRQIGVLEEGIRPDRPRSLRSGTELRGLLEARNHFTAMLIVVPHARQKGLRGTFLVACAWAGGSFAAEGQRECEEIHPHGESQTPVGYHESNPRSNWNAALIV